MSKAFLAAILIYATLEWLSFVPQKPAVQPAFPDPVMRPINRKSEPKGFMNDTMLLEHSKQLRIEPAEEVFFIIIPVDEEAQKHQEWNKRERSRL
jgi:hypothetical protein